MLGIAQDRLRSFSSRVTYKRTDLVDEAWEEHASKPIHAIVSTWALHDLGSPEKINTVYERAYSALDADGFLLNGDFIKPIGAAQEFEGGRLYIAEHVDLLSSIGFSDVSCLSLFEEEIEHPNPAQSYACIRAEK